MQLFILALIVTVLCKQMGSVDKTKKKLQFDDDDCAKLKKQSSTQRITILLQARLVRALKKLVCCACICMLSDICMLTIATNLVPSDFSRGISNIPYEVTLLVNMFTMVCTFNEPLAVLFPCLRKGNEDQYKTRAQRGSIRITIWCYFEFRTGNLIVLNPIVPESHLFTNSWAMWVLAICGNCRV